MTEKFNRPASADFRVVEVNYITGKRYAIYRAYYLDDKCEMLCGVSPMPTNITGADRQRLLERIELIMDAFSRPILIDPPIYRSHK